MILRYIFIYFLGLISCTSVTNRKNDENSKVLEKQSVDQDTNSSKGLTSGIAKTKHTDSLHLFEEHTESLSKEESIRIKRNPEYRFQLLANNRDHLFEEGDTSYYFSKTFETKIAFSNFELNSTHKFHIFLTNKNNLLLGQATVESLESEEGIDYFRPFEKGGGFVQYAFKMGGSMDLKVYTLQSNGKYAESFSMQSEKEMLNAVSVSDNSKFVALTKYKENKHLILSKYTVKGKLIFEKEFAKINDLSTSLNISPDGEYISYAYYLRISDSTREKRYCVFDNQGNAIIDQHVTMPGNYTSHFIRLNGTNYLIAEGIRIYIFNLSLKKLIKELYNVNPKIEANRSFIQEANLYVLYYLYEFENHHIMQKRMQICKYEISTGNQLSSFEMPIINQQYVIYDQNTFYLTSHEAYDPKFLLKLIL